MIVSLLYLFGTKYTYSSLWVFLLMIQMLTAHLDVAPCLKAWMILPLLVISHQFYLLQLGNNQVLKMTEFLAVPLAVLHKSACISAKRICAVRFVFPLAGIHNLLCISSSGNGNQNNYKISARGDAKFWLHFRKRNCRRWIVFPRGGIVNFHVHLRSRGRCTEIITKISACGDVKFWLHSRKRNCRFWIVFPRGGNKNFYVHLRSQGPWTEINTKSPLAGM